MKALNDNKEHLEMVCRINQGHCECRYLIMKDSVLKCMKENEVDKAIIDKEWVDRKWTEKTFGCICYSKFKDLK